MMNDHLRKIRILLIEDDVVDRMAFTRMVEKENLPYEFIVADSVSKAKEALKTNVFDVIISDYMLGDGTAVEILDMKVDAPVVITTGAGNEEIAVKAMKAGAYDYIIKDQSHNYLKFLPFTVEKAVKQKKTEERFRILSDKDSNEATIIGGSGLSEILRLVELAAGADSPVLISGETGTGKNVVAKAIHYKSAARNAPLVSINCAALPENLIEAELFGYEKGAFTGAVTAKKGIFELAESGTMFLDEIGEMPIHLQAKLLGAIEDRQVRRLGGESVRPLNARIIAATGVDLERELGRSFRKDLYYRLSVIRIHLPPLRQRRQDIPELCQYLLGKINGRGLKIPQSEIDRLAAYDWPGNVRELKNVLERAVILRHGDEVLPSQILAATSEGNTAAVNEPGAPILTIREMEKRHISQALQKFSGNITKTASVLGVPLSTFKRKIKSYGLK